MVYKYHCYLLNCIFSCCIFLKKCIAVSVVLCTHYWTLSTCSWINCTNMLGNDASAAATPSLVLTAQDQYEGVRVWYSKYPVLKITVSKSRKTRVWQESPLMPVSFQEPVCVALKEGLWEIGLIPHTHGGEWQLKRWLTRGRSRTQLDRSATEQWGEGEIIQKSPDLVLIISS